jgi:F0F1-type ATP synthase delta subunit
MIHFTNIFTHNKHKKNAFKSFFETDSEGRVIIPIGAEKIENFMSLFSINEYRVLSNDIYDNVGRIVDNLPINSKIAVHIKTSLPVSDEKKQELVESFKHNYLMKSIQTENTKRYNLIISSICYGAGILVFLLLLLLSIFAYHPGGEEKFIGAEVI